MRDTSQTFADALVRDAMSPVPVGAALRSLIGRLGRPDAPRPRPRSVEDPLAQAFELDILPTGSPQGEQVEAPRLASPSENHLRRLRANARAAYASVVASHDAALDAALAVIEAEWCAAGQDRDRYAEALKAIRLYSADAQSRHGARRALERRDAAPCPQGALSPGECLCRERNHV